MTSSCEAVVIGGGFYGCTLAVMLSQARRDVVLLEEAPDLLTRASYNNQARVHNGYHYPRSFMTGLRSVANYPRFVAEFRNCIDSAFEKVYAIAQRNSKVNAYQFAEFCKRIGAPVRPAKPQVRRLFDSATVEEVFSVREYAFNAARLRDTMRRRMENKVRIVHGAHVAAVEPGPGDRSTVVLANGGRVSAEAVFNCTYSRINCILSGSGITPLPLKHEITELALIEPPAEVRGLGITVMDGPFFSTMPFPAAGLYTLSHVRYTPHEAWMEPATLRDPYEYMRQRNPASRQVLMVKDAARYLPCIVGARYVRSLFEVKTVLVQNEMDDGRPILLRRHGELGNVYTIMGGKIDNVYDVLQALDDMNRLAKQPVASGAERGA